MWRRRLRYHILILLRLKGMPRRIALGFALGACINFYPTFGVGILLAAVVARLCGGNITAGVIGDVIFKPIFFLFFIFNVKSGSFILFEHQPPPHIMKDFLDARVSAFLTGGKIFFTGALVNTFILGSLLFVIVYIIFRNYRRKLLNWFWKNEFFRRKKVVPASLRPV